MAPKTRSANTFQTANTTDLGVEDVGETPGESPSTTPRKVPHCTKCKRPRAGHPRSGCPYVEAPGSEASSPNNSPRRQPTGSLPTTPGRRKLNLTEAMGSLQIREGSPRETDEELKATLRSRRKSQAPVVETSDSLRSLSTTSSEIVGILSKPGVLDDDTEPEDNIAPKFKPLKKGNTRIIQWQETVQVPANPNANLALTRPKSSPQSHMPGTLYTPNPSFFESRASIVKQEAGPEIMVTSPTASYTSDSPAPFKTKPLARTMSTEQREFFLSQIGSTSKAMIHVLPKAHVVNIAEEARDMGFLADIVMNDDEQDSQALLVVGKDDAELDKLLARVQLVQSEKKSAPSSTSGSTFKAVAGGAVVGVVSTWAGLAFS